jgi:hypothetical protein
MTIAEPKTLAPGTRVDFVGWLRLAGGSWHPVARGADYREVCQRTADVQRKSPGETRVLIRGIRPT